MAIVTTSTITFYYWSPSGQRLGAYQPGANGLVVASTNLYFGGRLISAQGHPVLQDRLGSNVSSGRRYYPYGEEKGTATANGIEKFATYFRDTSGNDYADQRYYSNALGRFLSADPSGLGSIRLTQPITWNLYSYTVGDPLNLSDPTGLEDCESGGAGGDDGGSACPTDGYGPDYWADYGYGAVPTWTVTGEATSDDTLNDTAQAVIGLINQYNPGGMIGFAGAVMGGGVMGAAGVALYGAASTAIALAGFDGATTAIVGGLASTGAYVGQAGYNVLNTPGWTTNLQEDWITGIAVASQAVWQVGPGYDWTAIETGFLQDAMGYEAVAPNYWVPPVY